MSLGEMAVALVGNPVEEAAEVAKLNAKHKRGCKCAACEAHRRKAGGGKKPKKKKKNNPGKPKTSKGKRAKAQMVRLNPSGKKIVDRIIDTAAIVTGSIGAQIGTGVLNEKLIKPTTRWADESDGGMKKQGQYRDFAEPAIKFIIGLLLGMAGIKGNVKWKKVTTLAEMGAWANAGNDLFTAIAEPRTDAEGKTSGGWMPGYRPEPIEAEGNTGGFVFPSDAIDESVEGIIFPDDIELGDDMIDVPAY